MTKKDRWILSEYRVAVDREALFNETLISHRMRSPYAEVDLLFETAAGDFILIEVKSVDRDLWGWPPLTTGQCMRLERARFWLESRSKRSVLLVVACVNKRGGITYFPAPFR